MERVIIVSSDSHGGLPAERYGEYLDPEYRDTLDAHLADVKALPEVLDLVGFPFTDEELDIIDDRGAIRAGGAKGSYDPVRRLAEAEAEGVVAEVIHPGTQNYGPAPFFEIMGARYTPEVRAAGARAYNRWLAEFCAHEPDRLIGVALTEPWPDMKAAIRQLEDAKTARMGGIWTDQFVGLEDEAPGFWDPVWDPFWTACVDLDLVVHMHIGFGIPQGTPQATMKEFMAMAKASDDPEAMISVASDLLDSLFPSRRPLWQLIWGGVFDRHPDLKVVFAEQHAGWLPPTLDYLDRVDAEADSNLPMKPSDYWRRTNLAVTCTSLRPSDLNGRDQIGVEKMMFGTDFPHMEGTWPNTIEWLQVALAGLREDEARAILGENAIEYYGLNRPKLEELAERIGPLASDVLVDSHDVDPRKIAHFHRRAGFNKDPLVSFDEEELGAAVEEDLEAVLLARP